MKLPLALPAIAVALVAAQVAHAGDTKPKLITFAKEKEITASVTLLKAEGKIGRDNPFYDNYRPQLKFSAEPEAVTCAIRIPKPAEKVDPGETAPVLVKCIESFKVEEGKLSFSMHEGGRKVGEGILRP